MAAPLLTPAELDQAAVRTIEDATVGQQWRRIIDCYPRTAPAVPAARQFVTQTVDELLAEALRAMPEFGTRPPVDVRLPGRLSRMLPDWAHQRRPDLSHLPSTQLYVAATILREWGWQAKPHKLRDRRGRRCICGAICTAVALGVGSADSAHRAAGYVLAELRRQNWPRYIGDWNQAPGRTAQQAIDLTLAAYQHAAAARQ